MYVVDLLDNDLYKYSMHQAALEMAPDTEVSYVFKNRDLSMKFSPEAFEALQDAVTALADLRLTDRGSVP